MNRTFDKKVRNITAKNVSYLHHLLNQSFNNILFKDDSFTTHGTFSTFRPLIVQNRKQG